MSEVTSTSEPLSPRTHLDIVVASKQLVDLVVAQDRERGVDPVTLVPVMGEGDSMHRPIYDLHPKVAPGWKGRFFHVFGGGEVSNFMVVAPADGQDPGQDIRLSAQFTIDSAAAFSEGTTYKIPSKTVVVPLRETLPEVREYPESLPTDEAVAHEGFLDEATGQDLLADLRDVLGMQL